MYRTDLDVCCSSHKAISNRTELLLSTKGILRRAERRIELYQIGRILLCNVNGRCMRDIHIIIRDICLNFFVFFCWFFLTLASHKSLEALARSRYPCPKRLEAKTHQLATYQAPMLPWWQGSRRGWQSQSGRCHFFGVPSFVIIFFEHFYFILINIVSLCNLFWKSCAAKVLPHIFGIMRLPLAQENPWIECRTCISIGILRGHLQPDSCRHGVTSCMLRYAKETSTMKIEPEE